MSTPVVGQIWHRVRGNGRVELCRIHHVDGDAVRVVLLGDGRRGDVISHPLRKFEDGGQWTLGTPVHSVRKLSWMRDAACAGMDTELFFPEELGRPKKSEDMARRVCSGCPVTDTCLEYGEETNSQYGVFGGKSGTERRALRQGG